MSGVLPHPWHEPEDERDGQDEEHPEGNGVSLCHLKRRRRLRDPRWVATPIDLGKFVARMTSATATHQAG